ncbi:hypothetical protein ACFL4T_05085 [candidate division KSB1 bacterium]
MIESNYGQKRHINLSESERISLLTEKEIDRVIASRTVRFFIQEPVFTQTSVAEISRGFSIKASARLFDNPAIKAAVQKKYYISDDTAAFRKNENEYNRRYNPEEYVRIEITLSAPDFESYVKSKFWNIYLTDGIGNYLEVEKIIDEGNIRITKRKIRYLGYNSRISQQFVYFNTFNIYIKKKDFYGLNLLDKKREYISLVFSHNQDIKGKAYWYFKER